MVNQKKPQAAAPAKESPVLLLLTGVICLGVGLGIGYYFGRQTAEVGSPVPVSGGQSQAGVMDPTAFVQNEANLKAMIASNPKDVNAATQLGNLYYDHGQYREAVEWYGKSLEIQPGNPDVLTDRGTSFWNLNQPDSAIAEFKKALASDPSHAQTLYNMGVVYLHGKNDAAEAKKAWQTLLATNPNYPDRAKVEQELSTLGGAAPGKAAGAASPGQTNSASPGMEDLLGRMKSRP